MAYLTNDGVVYLQQEILSLKKRLETCSVGELPDLQTRIKVMRGLLSSDKVEEIQEEIEI